MSVASDRCSDRSYMVARGNGGSNMKVGDGRASDSAFILIRMPSATMRTGKVTMPRSHADHAARCFSSAGGYIRMVALVPNAGRQKVLSRVAANPKVRLASSGKIQIRCYGASDEGPFVLKYFLVERPGVQALGRRSG